MKREQFEAEIRAIADYLGANEGEMVAEMLKLYDRMNYRDKVLESRRVLIEGELRQENTEMRQVFERIVEYGTPKNVLD